MNIALGIDTGGTYTDAVLVNHDTGEVLAGAKALTTRHDLALGISAAIQEVFASQTGAELHSMTGQRCCAPSDIVLVALSTTLATNTLAEGQRGAVCLILIGYEKELMAQWGFDRQLATEVEVGVTRQDHWAPTRGGGLDLIYLGTELVFSAAGRPARLYLPPPP